MNAKTLTAATVLLAAGLLLSACTKPQHQSGEAAPAGTAAAPTDASPTAAPTSPSATTNASTSPTVSASATTDLAVVLGPDGFGSLKLGMNRQQALATQMVASLPAATDGCQTGHLYGAGANTSNEGEGIVWLDPRVGVAAIYLFTGAHTHEGLHLGSTYDELMRTYPDWQPVDAGQKDDRGYAKVPGNADAIWRIVTSGGKVTSVALQLRSQGCYE